MLYYLLVQLAAFIDWFFRIWFVIWNLRSKTYDMSCSKSSPYANSHVYSLIFHIYNTFWKALQLNIYKNPSQFLPMHSNGSEEIAIANTGRNSHKLYSVHGNRKLLANNCFSIFMKKPTLSWGIHSLYKVVTKHTRFITDLLHGTVSWQ